MTVQRINAVGRQLTVRLISPSRNTNPVANFLASVNDLIEHAVHEVEDRDMTGLSIQNQVNQNEKPIGISFRQKNLLSADAKWRAFEKVSQWNA